MHPDTSTKAPPYQTHAHLVVCQSMAAAKDCAVRALRASLPVTPSPRVKIPAPTSAMAAPQAFASLTATRAVSGKSGTRQRIEPGTCPPHGTSPLTAPLPLGWGEGFEWPGGGGGRGPAGPCGNGGRVREAGGPLVHTAHHYTHTHTSHHRHIGARNSRGPRPRS